MNPKISSDLFNVLTARVEDLWHRSSYFRRYLAARMPKEALRRELRRQLERRVEQAIEQESRLPAMKPSSREFLRDAILKVLPAHVTTVGGRPAGATNCRS